MRASFNMILTFLSAQFVVYILLLTATGGGGDPPELIKGFCEKPKNFAVVVTA
jgi:hypothetical protein